MKPPITSTGGRFVGRAPGEVIDEIVLHVGYFVTGRP